MAYGIGIDTGGTYTDAVIYDFDTRQVLAKGKSPTTRQNLSLGIGRALDMLPASFFPEVRVVALSTTLATNACVEGKGGRARLLLMGTDTETLKWVKADRKYGFDLGDVLCLNLHGSYDGQVVEHPDWEQVLTEHDAFFKEAQALSVAEVHAMRNQAVLENEAREKLHSAYAVPLVAASDLVSGLNIMERGATALLNARLLPVIDQFMKAICQALENRGLKVQQVIVRSDGSMMTDEAARLRPVETVLSGPAASVMGCQALTEADDALIVDMGGTTTDISLVRRGTPLMTDGIRIGQWRTQIQGVYIDTFGLGGDTRVVIQDGKVCLDTRRVEPLCCAAAKWPQVRTELQKLLSRSRLHTRPLHEFLYQVTEPQNPDRYTAGERKLLALLQDGPLMIGGEQLDVYDLESQRLENEGIIMRCGLTPTDVMHIRGDYAAFDPEASRLGAEYFLRVLSGSEITMDMLCDQVYDLVKARLFENIVRVFLENAYPAIYKDGLDEKTKALIAQMWEQRHVRDTQQFFSVLLDVRASLVGIGAPIRLFLPDVAKALHTDCVLPEHGEVANAIGAVVADVKAQVQVEVRTLHVPDALGSFAVHSAENTLYFKVYEEALDAARQMADSMARAQARSRGALGQLQVDVYTDEQKARARDGAEIHLGTLVRAVAIGKLG